MHSFFRASALTLLLFTSPSSFAGNALALSSNGFHGMNGNPGFNFGGSAPDGYKGFNPGGRGGDGQRGRHGGDATAPSAGGNGGSIVLLLERDPIDATKLAYSGQVSSRPVSGSLDLNDQTTISLTALGGRGGNGASGANGQDGGRGGEGGDAGQNSFSSGDGGRGGDGGAGGSSTSGANGGNGGQIVLRLRKGQENLVDLVRANVTGGSGGTQPFAFVRGGRGAQGGLPGNNCFFGNDGYKCVSRGMNGMSGFDGRAPFGNPQPGSAGRPGSYSVQVIE